MLGNLIFIGENRSYTYRKFIVITFHRNMLIKANKEKNVIDHIGH